jgi:hypothetical protein
VKLNTHLYLVPKLRICRAILPFPPYVFTARYLVKDWGNFTFTFLFYRKKSLHKHENLDTHVVFARFAVTSKIAQKASGIHKLLKAIYFYTKAISVKISVHKQSLIRIAVRLLRLDTG